MGTPQNTPTMLADLFPGILPPQANVTFGSPPFEKRKEKL